MTFHIFTLFPDIFKSYFEASILKRAQKKDLIKIKIYNIRDFTKDKHKTADDRTYGGGAGMVMKAEPIIKAVDSVLKKTGKRAKTKVALFSAKGERFDQKIAFNWSKKYTDMFLICGRYEGIDERAKIALKAKEICIGPYILTDGEVPAMVVVSAIARLIPEVVNWESLEEESFSESVLEKEKKKTLEYPHYTRPEVFKWKGKNYRVPKVLLSGNHEEIKKWRGKNSKLSKNE